MRCAVWRVDRRRCKDALAKIPRWFSATVLIPGHSVPRWQGCTQRTIVRSLDDGQAEILRMAKRVEPRALRHRCGFEPEESFDRALNAQHGEIIDHIEGQIGR